MSTVIEEMETYLKHVKVGVGREDGEKQGEFSPIFYKQQVSS